MSVDFSLGYLLASLVAGLLTILSPCVLPLLPIIISGSVGQQSLSRAFRIIGALIVSLLAFSILLKATTSLIGIPTWVWQLISGSILIVFGLFLLMPNLWQLVIGKLGLKKSSNKFLSRGLNRGGKLGDFLVGASLGPVFSSCSPTYLAIVGFFLPASWWIGSIYLVVFVLGLAFILGLVAIFGQKFTAKVAIFSNPKSWLRRILATLFIVIGIFLMTGYDKKIETYLVERGWYDWLINLENNLT